MSKVTLNDIGTGFNLPTVVNANNDAIVAGFENTLSRDGTSPNSMEATIDMNSHRILNLAAPEASSDAARWIDVTGAVDITGVGAPAMTGNSGKYLGTDGSVATWSFVAPYYETESGETGVVNKTYKRGNVLRYGTNTVPGTTDMTTAFQNAGLSSLNPFAPVGDYKITGNIPLRDNQTWELYGARIQITGTSLEVYSADAGIDDWSLTGPFWSVTGDNGAAGATSGSAAAVRVTDAMRWRIDGLSAFNIKGWGIRLRPGSSISTRSERGQITRFQAYACYVALECEAGTGAEYAILTAPIIARCNTALRIAAGNLSVTGGSVTDNTLGIDLGNGSNHGHGVIAGVEINHNTTAIKANTVTNGQRFSGCTIFQGIIHFDHSTGVIISNGLLDVDTYRFEESVGCGFQNNTMCDGYANTITNDYNSSHSYTIWTGNRTKMGEPWRGSAGNIRGIQVTQGLASSQVFSAANVNATSVVKMDAGVCASANAATQTIAGYVASYVAATGIYTCVMGGDGRARVSAQFLVSNNAADAGKFQMFLTHSTLGDYYLIGETLSTTSIIFRLDMELPIDLTRTLSFKITGSGVANNVTITNSAGTKAQVEGL
jgi:hypothetical protein